MAAEVNANFIAVEIAVDGNTADIASMLELISTLQATIEALETSVAVLESDKTVMQNFIAEVLPHVEGAIDAQGNQAIFFSGVNVHVNNGEEESESVNGTGNLIMGYNESAKAVRDFCTTADSNGTAYPEQDECESSDGIWGRESQKLGSHNLVIGFGHSYTQSGGLVAGDRNIISGQSSSVTGGTLNLASAHASAPNSFN